MGKNNPTKNIRIVRGYLLLDILENEQPTSFIVEDKSEPAQRGKVLAVGSDTFDENGKELKSPAKVGDVVVHSAFGFENIKYKGEDYRLCPFTKVLAIIK